MKKADLEKQKLSKNMGNMKQASVPDRFGAASALPDRREQRRLDQAAGLVPFAAKLPETQVRQLQERAKASGKSLNETVAEVIAKGML